ncbi:BnaA10g12580D [Brassica napus]|uniref:(rape) hypothetical protein n=1 Tax=Brassica napus TaxID=3708 RepID=A0A078II01_BRANA|nr:unnamed protein product [Brassica napus]CDY49562.1 BnaA10g12580D [Brassica napus]
MASDDDSFSTYVDRLRAFHTRRFAAARESIEQENRTVPPPPPLETPTASTPPRATNLDDERNQSLLNSLRSAALTHEETETCLQSLTDVMTSSEDDDDALFQEVISNLDGSELQRMASLLTSNNDHYFLEIARNKNGSIRLHKLLGQSDDADTFFVASLLRHFLHVMTDRHAAYLATQGMRVFSHEKKMAMRDQILQHAVHLARDQYGCNALNAIISGVVFDYCRNDLHDVVAFNAPLLSSDAYGNHVVRHVLKQNNLRRTYDIAVRLRGHYVELSFTRYGSRVVEKLLEREETRPLVVAELLECGRDKLGRLATSVYGNFVVETSLKVTPEDLFRALVNKLKPFLPQLRRSTYGTNIAKILESIR